MCDTKFQIGILDCQSGLTGDFTVPGCDAVPTGEKVLTFRKFIVATVSGSRNPRMVSTKQQTNL